MNLDSLAILIPVALLLCFFVIAAFLWAVKSDQFEDLERHGQDILFDADQNSESGEKGLSSENTDGHLKQSD